MGGGFVGMDVDPELSPDPPPQAANGNKNKADPNRAKEERGESMYKSYNIKGPTPVTFST